ncbi:MAG: hypothetical protein IJ814_03955 [Paludibacteraceae bacterium]|nr:hypothetical protein [Paludibacteraceae bacterium]
MRDAETLPGRTDRNTQLYKKTPKADNAAIDTTGGKYATEEKNEIQESQIARIQEPEGRMADDDINRASMRDEETLSGRTDRNTQRY